MSFIDHGEPGYRFVVGECYESIRIAVMYKKASARFSSEVSGLPGKGSVALSRGCLCPGRTAQRLEDFEGGGNLVGSAFCHLIA